MTGVGTTPLDLAGMLESFMLKSGLSPEIIVAKIKTSVSKFDTAPATLRELKAAGVPEAVILAMLETQNPQAASSRAASPSALEREVEVKVPDGAPLEIEASYTVSSADIKAGDALSFRVVMPLVVNGVTVVEEGALATGRVVNSASRRRVYCVIAAQSKSRAFFL